MTFLSTLRTNLTTAKQTTSNHPTEYLQTNCFSCETNPHKYCTSTMATILTAQAVQVVSDEDVVAEEEADNFPSRSILPPTAGTDNNDNDNTNSTPVFDLSLMTTQAGSRGPASVTATELATDVGSVVGPPRDPFLKSITFLKESLDHDDQTLGVFLRQGLDTTSPGKKGLFVLGGSKAKLYVSSVTGMFALSGIQPGDYLKSINGKTVGPSMNPDRAMSRMAHCLDREGYLSVAVKNKEEGVDDILIQATIIKPRPNMTYTELGLVVWVWGYLCIKSISKVSIFKRTILKETDHITAINDISCENMTPEQFAHVITRLPFDVTLTILRRKERATGKFG